MLTADIKSIYKITQKSTGKSYVGKTIGNPFHRAYQHFFAKEMFTPLQKEIYRSTISDWTFEILEVVQTDKKLHEREIFWINKCESRVNGFNININVTASISPIVLRSLIHNKNLRIIHTPTEGVYKVIGYNLDLNTVLIDFGESQENVPICDCILFRHEYMRHQIILEKFIEKNKVYDEVDSVVQNKKSN